MTLILSPPLLKKKQIILIWTINLPFEMIWFSFGNDYKVYWTLLGLLVPMRGPHYMLACCHQPFTVCGCVLGRMACPVEYQKACCSELSNNEFQLDTTRYSRTFSPCLKMFSCNLFYLNLCVFLCYYNFRKFSISSRSF